MLSGTGPALKHYRLYVFKLLNVNGAQSVQVGVSPITKELVKIPFMGHHPACTSLYRH